MAAAVVTAHGVFITIEGGEGVGKSTQARLLVDRLHAAGATVLRTREPGGTPVGDRIRELLLDPAARMAPSTELLLYEASRAELVSTVIEPALARGESVVCDRFYDSTTAYQAYGRGIDAELIHALNMTATGGVRPDATVYLALPVEDAMPRATHGGADRMEAESLDFHRRVVEGFEAIAAAEPGRVLRIDARGDVCDVAARVWSAVAGHPAVQRSLSGSD
jgi:dTMP kinase